ncbi:MAG: DUF523 domain-containing protein [Deltaproteobacteria bacterium]|nr:DUF523 domain-containing protein [Deltaproteobacteria bacterium]
MDCKPVVVVSRCLTGENSRYDGEIINNEFVKRMGSIFHFIPFCPEIEAHMGVPRNPIILVRKRNGNMVAREKFTGIDKTETLIKVSKDFLESLKEVHGFLLKSKSPSCGWKDTKIYDSYGTQISSKGKGLFSRQIRKYFPYVPIVSDSVLNLSYLRMRFVLKVFSFYWVEKQTIKMRSKEDIAHFEKEYAHVLKNFGIEQLSFGFCSENVPFDLMLEELRLLLLKAVSHTIDKKRLLELYNIFSAIFNVDLKLAVTGIKC